MELQHEIGRDRWPLLEYGIKEQTTGEKVLALRYGLASARCSAPGDSIGQI